MLNINKKIPTELVTAGVVSHPTRAVLDAYSYDNVTYPVIMPLQNLTEVLGEKKKLLDIKDYGLRLKKGDFKIQNKGCTLEWPLAAAYAFAVSTQAGANKISLVGFDGFDANDPRQEEMNSVFKTYARIKNSVSITSLTPSKYKIAQGSIYSNM